MDRVKLFYKSVEPSALTQIEEMSNCEAYKDCTIRIMPDCHAGSGCTIGTVIEVKDRIVPNTVGVDIGCGMYVCEIVSENMDLSRLDEVVNKYIPSGFNVHDVPVRHFPQLSSLFCKDVVKCDYIQRSVGTLGGGNHFIEVDKGSNGNYFLVIHSGSRNLGVTVCDYYQKIAEEECGIDPKERQMLIDKLKSEGRQREIADAIRNLCPKVKNMTLAYLEGRSFRDYLHDMEIAQMYARINRETIAEIIFEKMGWSFADTFHTVHNYIDTTSMILRKGAVEAGYNDLLIIPMNMRDGSLLCRGKGNDDWLYSAPHGAGRLMSRKQAFDTLKMEDFEAQMSGVYSTSVCPSTIDESPMAYKPMQEIIDTVGDTVEILDIIKPVYNFKSYSLKKELKVVRKDVDESEILVPVSDKEDAMREFLRDMINKKTKEL